MTKQFLSMNVNKEFKRMPGLWKFNKTLLQDESYLQIIKDCYPHSLQKYANVDDKQLLWELTKLKISLKRWGIPKGKAKNEKRRENVIRGRIEVLDSKICNEVCLDQNILSEHENFKKELQEIYEQKGRGTIFRSKARWTDNGEPQGNNFLTSRKQDRRRRLFTIISNWRR